MPWADVDFDPFAAPAPRAPPKVSLTVGRNAPPPETIPDAPREAAEPKLAPWAKEVDHIPDFPEPEPEQSTERPGFLETAKRSGELLDADLHRQRSAASQGTTPNLEAHEKNMISDNVMEGDDGNLHYLDSEGRLQPTDTNKHVALKGNDGKIRVYARTPDTDEGRMSAGGRLMQTGMATETPRFGTEGLAAGARVLGIGSRGSRVPAVHPAWLPPDATPEAIQAAERLGVNLPKAIASDSGTTQYLAQTFKGSPGGAPLRTAIEEGLTHEDRGLAGALTRQASDAGDTADARLAGEGVTTGLEGTFKPESQKLVKQLYDRVATLVDPHKTAPLTEVMRTVGDILARRQARNNNDLGKAVETVSGALQRRGGLTYEAMKDLRTELREIKQRGEKGGLLPEGMSQRELGDIYTALTKDLGSAAEITGGPAARTAWERANTLSNDRKEVLEVLNKVVGSKSRSDEGVYATLLRMAGTGPGADIEALARTKDALQGIPGHLPGSPGAWENVSSTVISRLGRNSQGEFSPNLFIRDYDKLSPEAKRLLFHGVGRGDVLGSLDDIATVSRKYVQAGKLANTSGTAGHATATAALTTAAASLMKGDVVTPIKILAVGVGANVTSRLLGAPATAASVARWTRAMDNLTSARSYTGITRAWAAYNMASRNLANTTAAAGGDPSAAPHIQQKLQGLVRRPNERDDQQGQ